jgi:hypothetical protein
MAKKRLNRVNRHAIVVQVLRTKVSKIVRPNPLLRPPVRVGTKDCLGRLINDLPQRLGCDGRQVIAVMPDEKRFLFLLQGTAGRSASRLLRLVTRSQVRLYGLLGSRGKEDPPLSTPFSDNFYPLCVPVLNLCAT